MLKIFAQGIVCLAQGFEKAQLVKVYWVQVPKLQDLVATSPHSAPPEAGLNVYVDMKLISFSCLVHMGALQRAYTVNENHHDYGL